MQTLNPHVQSTITALIPVLVAFAVVILERLDRDSALNTVDYIGGLQNIEFGEFRKPAADAAMELMNQRAFFTASVLATVPAATKAFITGGSAAGAAAVGLLSIILIVWYFRWRSLARPEDKVAERKRRDEMFYGSVIVVAFGGVLSVIAAWAGAHC